MTGRRRTRPFCLLLTCEHADHRVPREHMHLFRGAQSVLRSHRGWDPGALALARLLSRRLEQPLLATRWSRLVVEANRSLTNPRLWSVYTRDLDATTRARIVERYWRPHRTAVEQAVESLIAGGGRVLHVGVHSFTPEIDGEVRTAEVGLLFDSRRSAESRFARVWRSCLLDVDPELRVRLNYPYLGRADGLTTALRGRHPAARYLGIELEVNQARATAPDWRKLGETIAASLADALRAPRRRG